MSSIVGAILVIVRSSDSKLLITALSPEGPAAVDELPPGTMLTSALPQSTSLNSTESRELIVASA